MRKINDLDYFKLNKFERLWYNTINFFQLIPKKFIQLFTYIFSNILYFYPSVLMDFPSFILR